LVGLASSDIEGKRYHAPFVAIKRLSGLISSLRREALPEIAIVVAGIVRTRDKRHNLPDGPLAGGGL
ncbi:MAG TPA: hypothetical protein PKI49_05595, partial [Pseudomonadota bacterium]|nr:hypothetical protein [Pseudomonadota bacterium]HNO67964.1 hypothetical protein [Pseudomonadota bacterium]